MLDGYVDVYLPDFKYMEPELAAAYSKAPDYPEYAKSSLKEMIRQTGNIQINKETGMIQKRRDRKTSGSAGACKKFQSGHKISARNIQRPDSDQHYESIYSLCRRSQKIHFLAVKLQKGNMKSYRLCTGTGNGRWIYPGRRSSKRKLYTGI